MLLLTTGLSFASNIIVENPYVREVPPGVPTSASFLTLTNNSNNIISLVKASSDVAKNVELHEHVHNNGMMEMRQVQAISVPANGKTVLKPGGYHIMLIGLTRKIKSGDTVDINLEFDDGSKQAIKADVKKIMKGMMMGGMKKKGMMMGGMKKNGAMMEMKKKKHVNPMPNLMSVYKKMGDKLNLSNEQVAQLDAGIKERNPAIKELTASVMKLEEDILQAALNDEPLEKIDQLANNLMQDRLSIVKGKTYCRESAKKVLNDKQFNKVVTLYRENFMSKPKMNEMQAKMAMKKHTNPMPNLMMVVKKMSDKLNLSEQQATDLKQWSDERGPVMAKQYKAVMKLEADLHEAALNNEPTDRLAALSDGVMQVRMKIIRGKALCRDNMKRILNNDQYNKVKELFKANFQ